MEFIHIIGFCIVIPFVLGLGFLIGHPFRKNVLNHKVDEDKSIKGMVFSTILGLIILFVIVTFIEKVGIFKD